LHIPVATVQSQIALAHQQIRDFLTARSMIGVAAGENDGNVAQGGPLPHAVQDHLGPTP
jgi:hypothetical protein